MELQKKHTVAIVGISSSLGIAVSQQLTTNHDIQILGGYRTWNTQLECLNSSFNNTPGALHLTQVDVLQEKSREEFLNQLFSQHDQEKLTIIYCCGQWSSGPVADLTQDEIDRMLGIGLSAPIYFISKILQFRKDRLKGLRFIIITGLGGERTAVRYNALYSSATTGLQNFIRSTGMELAGTGASCYGVCLGLFDKGQSYIHELCSKLVIKYPTPLKEIVDFMIKEIQHETPALNGGIVELSGGLFNYQEVAKILTESEGVLK